MTATPEVLDAGAALARLAREELAAALEAYAAECACLHAWATDGIAHEPARAYALRSRVRHLIAMLCVHTAEEGIKNRWVLRRHLLAPGEIGAGSAEIAAWVRELRASAVVEVEHA